VFAAHSLGGLVVKQALVIAKNNDSFKEIREATSSLVFFAVPHQGGHGTTLGTIARNIVTALNGEKQNELLQSLATNSLFQESQAEFFRQQLEDYQILTVIEDLPTVLARVLWRPTSKVRQLLLRQRGTNIAR
jgi:triacylglycerol esterase/lipase EstA (alpha/beta hydrolase family)